MINRWFKYFGNLVSQLDISGLNFELQHGDHVELPHALHCFSAIITAWITFIFIGILYYGVYQRMSSEFCEKTVYQGDISNIYFE